MPVFVPVCVPHATPFVFRILVQSIPRLTHPPPSDSGSSVPSNRVVEVCENPLRDNPAGTRNIRQSKRFMVRPSGCGFQDRYAKLNCASKCALPGDKSRIHRASAEVAFFHLIRCCAEAFSLRECRENQLLVSNEGLPAGLDRVSCDRRGLDRK